MNVNDIWQERGWRSRLLLPLTGLFILISGLRRLAYRRGWKRSVRLPVPVIVVGNITVGGSGKTPLVIWLARHLAARGLRPGIVSRGYGGNARSWPQQVRGDSDPSAVGDEPVLIAGETGCPMAAGPDRAEACRALLRHHDCDVLISDDGLQHYRMQRDLEIVVIDGQRRFGNGRRLPAGPLREPVSRIAEADIAVVNGQPLAGEFQMGLVEPVISPLGSGEDARPLGDWAGREVHAVAGIGHPARFFELLRSHGLKLHEHPFPDHHAYKAADLELTGGLPILMTAKDAVKCRRFTGRDIQVVRVRLAPSAEFVDRLDQLLAEVLRGPKAA